MARNYTPEFEETLRSLKEEGAFKVDLRKTAHKARSIVKKAREAQLEARDILIEMAEGRL